MRVIKGGRADKLGITFKLSPLATRLSQLGNEWQRVIKDPASYTKGRLS